METDAQESNRGGWGHLARVFLLLGLAVTALLSVIFGLAWCAAGGG